MSKEILISVEPQEKRVAIVSNDGLEEFYIERPQDKTTVGNIYKGKVEAVVPSVAAAFVDIGLAKKGFLYLSEIVDSLEPVETNGMVKNIEVKPGQEVLVQVVKESFGTKGPRLSCHIGLAGKYLVLLPEDLQTSGSHLPDTSHRGPALCIGISRRIEDEQERRRLRQIFQELKIPTKDVGFIVRTAAKGRLRQELLRDAKFLLKLWSRLERIAKKKKAPTLIYEEYDLILRVIRDCFGEDVSKLIVDSKLEYGRIMRFMKTFLGYLTNRVELYKGDGLFEEKGIEKQINKIFETKIYLKSKAHILIEPTEGLVVIDVNSGGFKQKIGQKEAAFKINCEAAAEIARNIILRDLGGIIVIDFIDMEEEKHRREVLNVLKSALIKDRAKYDILGISKFGLVEMTRERIHKTVQMLSYQPCPYCQGRGRVRSPVTTAIYALKELKRFLKNNTARQVNLMLNPIIIDELLKNKADLMDLEHGFKTKINLMPNPTAHLEEIKIT